MQNKKIKDLIEKYGKTYSSILGINLESNKEEEIFEWFLASILFGKPIQENVAIKTIRLFFEKGITTPDKILRIGWQGLVDVLDEGKYVRYDFSTATKLLEIMKKLKKDYNGKITNLFKMSKGQEDLIKRLLEFKGIGPTTVNIFLRELRHLWNVDIEECDFVKLGAKKLNINLNKFNKKTKDFVRLECALLRVGKDIKRKMSELRVGFLGPFNNFFIIF